ncbi:hypothetical protein U8335_13065 [Roseiconus lacunae]|uniref:hypothetical protein n=1 Tax=Roseiconus lacunae TaxID=2605694 RepID=UPI00308CAD21|nr:hypothetical protein U8335_13065 [Stieleria sp. HD01]
MAAPEGSFEVRDQTFWGIGGFLSTRLSIRPGDLRSGVGFGDYRAMVGNAESFKGGSSVGPKRSAFTDASGDDFHHPRPSEGRCIDIPVRYGG